MYKYLLISFLLPINLIADDWEQGFALDENAVESYIAKYSLIAQELMITTGVPASIKLAQGILESNSGRSTLAVEANNHFGIKCGPSWAGETYYREDDDKDAHGRLRPSCFRVFASAEESFVLHSEFLRDPRKAYRYGFLFELDPMDYKAWARGLKKSGYATNPKYADLLITLIEKYGLHGYDRSTTGEDVYAVAKKEDPENQGYERQANAKDLGIKTRKINGSEAFRYKQSMALEDIARAYGMSPETLAKYNDWPKNHRLQNGELIFLEAKNQGYAGSIKWHKADGQETLRDIAQRYGIKADALAQANKMRAYDRPKKGKKIKFKSLPAHLATRQATKTTDPRKHRTESHSIEKATGEYLFEITLDPSPKKNESKVSEEKVTHLVERGETLYSISRLYGVSVEELKRLNKLQGNELKLGSEIRIN